MRVRARAEQQQGGLIGTFHFICMEAEQNLFAMWSDSDERAFIQIADAARSDRDHAIELYLKNGKDGIRALQATLRERPSDAEFEYRKRKLLEQVR